MTREEIEDAVELAEQRLAGGREMHLDRRWEDNADDIADLSRAVLALVEERGRMEAEAARWRWLKSKAHLHHNGIDGQSSWRFPHIGKNDEPYCKTPSFATIEEAIDAALEPRDHDAATRREE